ncbi:MAG TPA: O-antigen ligase family protein [Gaiellaceae bacterium]|nr:O-antigen ligase family protein [Gaiellaceae bacterium]
MDAAGEPLGRPSVAGAAAFAAAFCALFFANAGDLSRLVWIGALALGAAVLPLAAALVGRAPAVRPGRAGGAFLGCLAGLAVWTAASTAWSLSPDRSWQAANRTLVYLAFALAGVVLASRLRRPAASAARAAAVLLGLLYGWALLAKCVPALYPDYGRLSRLRAPLGYWNELALLGAVGVPLALWLAAPRRRRRERAAGVVLLFAAGLVTLLTYSRVGVVLAVLAAVAWLLLSRERVEGLVALALGGGAAVALFGVALALPGITGDGEPRGTRASDGGIFAAAVLAAAALVWVATARLATHTVSEQARRRVERAAAVAGIVLAVAAIAAAAAFSGRIWHSFANPVTSQIRSGSGRTLSLNSSNRWTWWQEEWSAFADHPLAGTGAGTFKLTDLRLRQSALVTSDEAHNVPLQLLGELGIVGFLLYLGAAAAAAAGIVAARRRAAGPERAAVTALGVAVAAFAVHTVVDMDWSYLATCGPLLLATGLAIGREPAREREPVRRPLVAAAAALASLGVVYSLAAPWLAQRALAAGTEAGAKRAHSYNPLSTDALTTWAAYVDAGGDTFRALELYRDAVSLEPQSSETWWELGSFYAAHDAWPQAYQALSKSWRYDRYGPAGTPCGLLDQARHEVLGVWPPSCPRGSPRAATP